VAAGAPLDTSTIGPHRLTVDASDAVGNRASRVVDYTVRWDFDGFLAPVDALPTVNSVSAGRTVPIKFSLAGGQGLGVLADGAPRSQQVSCDPGATVDAIEATVSAGSTHKATVGDVWYASARPRLPRTRRRAGNRRCGIG